MKTAAQILIVALLLIGLLSNLYHDVEGRPQKAPGGFNAILTSLVVTAVIVVIYAIAGAFSNLIP